MKDLLLLRHAKSAWSDPEADDFDRDLSRRGRANAPAMAAWIRSKLTPERVLCSTARRTRRTVALMDDLLAGIAIEYDDRLYLAEAETILACLAETPAAVSRVMIVGHNPGLQELAVSLTPVGTTARARMATKFPTCAVAWFKIDTDDWGRVADRATLHRFKTPNDL